MDIRHVSRHEATEIDSGVAVVVDVMRAYTTAAWAFHLGADRIILHRDLEEAVATAAGLPGALLFKDGAPDPRFDLHNSPEQIQGLDVSGKTIVQRTTAGTVGAVAANGAERLWCTGYACAGATVDAVRRSEPDLVTIVVTGDDGTAEEDLSCAELMTAWLRGEDPDPAPFLGRARESRSAQRLTDAVEQGYGGVGARDVELCVELDRFDFAMRARSEADGLTLRREPAL